MRIETDVVRGPALTFTVDGQPVAAFGGETVAAAMTAAGIVTMRRDRDGRPHGLFCNMGTCCECLVSATMPGQPMLVRRACLLPAEEGMAIVTRSDAGDD